MSVDIDPGRLKKFGDLLHEAKGTRVNQKQLWQAFARAFPDRPARDQRAMFTSALTLLERANQIRLPATRGDRWDRTQSPAVPLSVDLVRAPKAPPSTDWKRVAWHPRIAWVLDLPKLPANQEAFMRRLNEALIDQSLAQRVPFKYRSLQLTANEKELESLLGTSLFAANRLRLEDLNCDRETLPLPWHRVGKSSRVLIFENPGPFHVAREVLAKIPDPRYGIVACGGGNSVTKSIAYLKTIDPAVTHIHYVGDLDLPGLSIALRAQAAAAAAGLPKVEPAGELHQLMLDQRSAFGQPLGWTYAEEPLEATTAEDALRFLDPRQREQSRPMITAGRRVPEEVLGPAELARVWAEQKVPAPVI